MALGTLADQITYPQTIPQAERTPEIEEKLMDLLKLVGIEYLVERWSGTDRIEWGGSTTYGAGNHTRSTSLALTLLHSIRGCLQCTAGRSRMRMRTGLNGTQVGTTSHSGKMYFHW